MICEARRDKVFSPDMLKLEILPTYNAHQLNQVANGYLFIEKYTLQTDKVALFISGVENDSTPKADISLTVYTENLNR